MLSDLVSYIAHLGIVRVLSVPGAMGLLLYIIWVLASPPKNHDDDAASAG